ncbi:SDR family NAD(P)-dependent oxidoreductase [Saccharothrix sp. HUAS TT1]|uniref:SDR family NAD(P)-dependent oxidoreductase n=1 Tax=unclassified Saccharothrix TaxID=2593673 RepID=UPI00345BAEA0
MSGWAARLLYSRPRVRPARLHHEVRDRVVVVTGASHGVGRHTARMLAAAGATVLVLARSAELLDELVEQVRADGGRAHAYPVDLADFDAVREVAERILAAHGPVDVLVNNAGKSIRRSVELAGRRFHDFRRLTDVNYLGPLRLTLELLPAMRAAGRGRVVSVSTFAARMPPFPRWGGYQASKTAFDVWLRSLAPEVVGDGVRVVTVYLGLVDTRMSAPLLAARRIPALHVQDAARTVCAAVCTRRHSLGPWWCLPVGTGAWLVARPLRAVLGWWHRRGRDTPAARGVATVPPQAGRGTRALDFEHAE